MKKFAVVLSGCGVYDGAEIHEAVLTLLAIDRAGASYQCFAPEMLQHHVINHLDGTEMAEKRDVLVESARIARGNIKPLSAFVPPTMTHCCSREDSGQPSIYVTGHLKAMTAR